MKELVYMNIGKPLGHDLSCNLFVKETATHADALHKDSHTQTAEEVTGTC